MNAKAKELLTCSRKLKAAAAAANEDDRQLCQKMADSAYDRYLQAMEEGPE